MSAKQFMPNSNLHNTKFHAVTPSLLKFKIFAQPIKGDSLDIEPPISFQKPRAYPTKKGRSKYRPPRNAMYCHQDEPPVHLMNGLDLHGQMLRLLKLQAPPQVHLVDFPFLDLGHPGRGF